MRFLTLFLVFNVFLAQLSFGEARSPVENTQGSDQAEEIDKSCPHTEALWATAGITMAATYAALLGAAVVFLGLPAAFFGCIFTLRQTCHRIRAPKPA